MYTSSIRFNVKEIIIIKRHAPNINFIEPWVYTKINKPKIIRCKKIQPKADDNAKSKYVIELKTMSVMSCCGK